MRSRFTAATIAGLALAPALSAQATFMQMPDTATHTVVVGDSLVGPGVGVNNPLYLPPSTDNNYSGVVNIWLDNLNTNQRFGCTGSLIGDRKVLLAAHCVTNASGQVDITRFQARFRRPDGTFMAITGTEIAVSPNYSGAVLEEQDVAVITLSADAPAFARRYTLFQGNPLVSYTMAGYGRTGTGVTGGIDNIANNQFGAVAVLRAGRNVFETTANDAGFFATSANTNAAAFGGILVSDFDRIGQNFSTNFICGGLGFCGEGVELESSIGSGDSGGAAFSNDWAVPRRRLVGHHPRWHRRPLRQLLRLCLCGELCRQRRLQEQLRLRAAAARPRAVHVRAHGNRPDRYCRDRPPSSYAVT